MRLVNGDTGRILLPIARSAIGLELGLAPGEADEGAPWLQEPGACFITLMKGERLRGCIGTLEPHRPLVDDVKANARAAAFRDPRFKPVAAHEFAGIDIEISVLSELYALACPNEEDALAQITPGAHGVVFRYGHHSSTFLPQVWEQLPDPAEFMAELKRKAGLPPDFWDTEVKLMRYTVSKWREVEAKRS
jgi:AmmeMemoRadiSam system protein A